MAEPPSFDQPEPPVTGEPEPIEPERPTGGLLRWITVAIVGLLVVSMVFLAWVSGRGAVQVAPATPEPTLPGPVAVGSAAAATPGASFASSVPSTVPSSRPATGPGPSTPRLAVIEPDGRLFTIESGGNGIVRHGDGASSYLFPAWSPDGRRIAAIADGPTGGAIHVFDEVAGSSAPPAPPTIV